MSTKIKVFLDSGANAFSCYEQVFDLADLSLTLEEYNDMSSEEKDNFFREIAWDRMDWGYYLVEEDE